jgi:hypothetical protein
LRGWLGGSGKSKIKNQKLKIKNLTNLPTKREVLRFLSLKIVL